MPPEKSLQAGARRVIRASGLYALHNLLEWASLYSDPAKALWAAGEAAKAMGDEALALALEARAWEAVA